MFSEVSSPGGAAGLGVSWDGRCAPIPTMEDPRADLFTLTVSMILSISASDP